MSSIACHAPVKENQPMLDAKELAKRLRAAMDNHNPRILSVELASRCGVTPQAVNGWRNTGRIAKGHLFTICQVTGQPLEFFLEERRGDSKATKIAWQRMGASLALLLALISPSNDSRAGILHNTIPYCTMIAWYRWFKRFLCAFSHRFRPAS